MTFNRGPKGTVLSVMLIVAALAVTGCTPPPRMEPPRIAFSGPALLRLEAERPVAFVEAYRAPLTRPNVEHEYAIVPAQIVQAWARDRLELSGNGGNLRITIVDASVVQEIVPKAVGVMGFFRKETDRRLNGRLEVQLDYVGVNGGSVRAVVEMSRGIMEGTHPNEVERKYYDLMQDMAKAFDGEMTRQIQSGFGRVTRGPA